MDITKGDLIPTILRLAFPSVIQAILSNCYAFVDFLFVGHIPDLKQSSFATGALSATVGLQTIAFAVNNCIPAGSNTYIAQYKGAKNHYQVAKTFRAAFYACLVISSLVAILGVLNIHIIASLCNADEEVTHAIEVYLGILLASSPAFGLMLLVDGFFKSCGDTLTPLSLEVASLLLNASLNYLLVLVWNKGIAGSALATGLSRLLPAIYGLVCILNGRVEGIKINLLYNENSLYSTSLTYSSDSIDNITDMDTLYDNSSCITDITDDDNDDIKDDDTQNKLLPSKHNLIQAAASDSASGNNKIDQHNKNNSSMNRFNILSWFSKHSTSSNSNAQENILAPQIDKKSNIISNSNSNSNTSPLKVPYSKNKSKNKNMDIETTAAADSSTDVESDFLMSNHSHKSNSNSNSSNSSDGNSNIKNNSKNSFQSLSMRCMEIFKIGVFESISLSIYGVVFTLLIRLSGKLGESQQAGLGAGMRGLEWIAFCLSEGFLVASAAAVGQCIGAGMQKRAMYAALVCAVCSSVSTGIMGVPFIFMPERISSVLSSNAEIVKYCGRYLYIVGFSMVAVGWEMAAYGAFLGAGQASKLCIINGTINILRVPITVYCMYGATGFWSTLGWVLFGLHSHPHNSQLSAENLSKKGSSSSDYVYNEPALIGGFDCLCWVISGTAFVKALVFMVWFMHRVYTKQYFRDSQLTHTKTY